MRITGGILRGRSVAVPRAGVRPTQDRVRAALFSILGSRVAGARFLDLFAGSGAVGIEAFSRGASGVCWVESSRRVLPVLRRNVLALCGPGQDVRACDVLTLLKKGFAAEPFDVIFTDPPYERVGRGPGSRARESAGNLETLAGAVFGSGALARGGVFVLERATPGGRDRDAPCLAARSGLWRVTDRRRYGTTELLFAVEGAGRVST